MELERFILSMERIKAIKNETIVAEPFVQYFKKTASFIEQIDSLFQVINEQRLGVLSFAKLKELNNLLYEDILPENYNLSYGNPVYAVKMLGEEYGRLLSFLYVEIRGMIVYAFEKRLFDIVICNELFLEVYNVFAYCAEEDAAPETEDIKQILYWYASDYSDIVVKQRVREQLDPGCSFAADIIEGADLTDLRYLYLFGEYVSENVIRTAEYLNTLRADQIKAMADTYTEGYRMGFLNSNKDLSKKKVVNIRYCLGFERIIREAIKNFADMGLRPTIYRSAVHIVNKKGQARIGYFGAIPNKQFDYDHKEDEAVFLDKAFMNRKLEVLKAAYEEYKEWAFVHAGPAVMEIFGETPFIPESKQEAYKLSDKQQKISVEYASEAGQIVNSYIKGEERSFTIIAYPVPEIGEQFQEIFEEVIKINTLDYKLYESMQQAIINILDQAVCVEVKGFNGNETDLSIALYTLKNPEKETIFENCVADVNIPVGEVFTSPKLLGTSGVLHVSEVYLDELKYIDLKIQFIDGMVANYHCNNFKTEEENKKYIKDNILHHHETLPMGEFAIGTNTTAYVVAQKYHIADKLPILIAEKMGPHFAVGDTCYSYSEDVKIFNKDGKEIVARDNDVSALRKVDPKKAYVNCHTDITIPYDELGELTAVKADGAKIPIIVKGRFVLAGCEQLNAPFMAY